MIVYRGPSTKEFYDDSHEIVDVKKLADSLKPWHSTAKVAVNLSKDGIERQAVGTIEFDPNDILCFTIRL
jgi:hypothetical protein